MTFLDRKFLGPTRGAGLFLDRAPFAVAPVRRSTRIE
jgi:hypothetical protein